MRRAWKSTSTELDGVGVQNTPQSLAASSRPDGLSKANVSMKFDSAGIRAGIVSVTIA
jgi:hypothetical protein